MKENTKTIYFIEMFKKQVVINNKVAFRKYARLKCFCGKVFEVRYEKYKSGKVKSCKCSQYTFEKSKLEGNLAAINKIYKDYKSNAKRRNIEFKISKDELTSLIEKECYYCNTKGSNTVKTTFYNYNYNGLDREDNAKGYTMENVLPCCKNCNLAKNILSKEEFLNLIKLIYIKNFSF